MVSCRVEGKSVSPYGLFMHPQLFTDEQLSFTSHMHLFKKREMAGRGREPPVKHRCALSWLGPRQCTESMFGTAVDRPPLGRWSLGGGQPRSPTCFNTRSWTRAYRGTGQANTFSCASDLQVSAHQTGLAPETSPFPQFSLCLSLYHGISQAFTLRPWVPSYGWRPAWLRRNLMGDHSLPTEAMKTLGNTTSNDSMC